MVQQQPGDILVVEDELAISQWVSDALRDEGYNVRVARDGASGLLAMRERAPDLVLLDIAMPVMTGDELLLRMRRGSFPDLPVVVMTAGLHAEIFLSQGATYVLSKPIMLETLLEVVAHYVRVQRARVV